ncbi:MULTISPECIES: Y-family DNA polymerase [Weissella]|uniref:UmuC domain-containing protein n=1 Tax=Weissella fermenti TaxID=2987699 RepID=A0ABT6D521_9LACO|nr:MULTISPECIES: hypothetical protein [Weissella]MCW0928038.1 hypothetical protein [Weissella sp. LMG 11983]MDF9300628.1 hypothetical protein [Weissella sp. BK2]
MYSIDESILDVIDSWQYWQSQFGKDITLKGGARLIQLAVKQELGLYLTVGIGDTPAMAKFALDLEAKHDFNKIVHKLRIPRC